MTEQLKNKFLDFCKSEGFNIDDDNSPQREAVLSNKPAVIPAGAGSGKTTVLSYRFLRLIIDDEEDIHSDEILTITFTKAATANMKAKIFRLLKKAENKGLLGSNELSRFGKAEISTTDSFCAKIAKEDAIRYGFSPSFTIEDNRDYTIFAERAFRDAITPFLNHKGMKEILSLIPLESLSSAFVDMASKVINVTREEKSEEERIKEIRDNTFSYLEKERDKMADGVYMFAQNFIEKYSSYDKFLVDVELCKEIITNLQNKTFKELSKPFTKNRLDSTLTEDRNNVKKSYNELLTFSAFNSEKNLVTLTLFSLIFIRFEDELIKHKREQNTLTFSDVMNLSIDILKNNKRIRDEYRNKFKRIMVDEFQDNNEDNKNLVYLLASNDSYGGGYNPGIKDIIIDKIFMVGDEKQSIYRFRGADVSVFKRISQDVGEERVLPLSQNFRSEGELIDKINTIFCPSIMNENEEDDYEASYRALYSKNKRVNSKMMFLYMHENEEDKKDHLLSSSSLSEAYEVARYIKEEILIDNSQYKIPYKENGEIKYRPPVPEDIAILLRKGSHQGDLEKALRLFSLPFSVLDNRSLTEEALINDFYSALELAIYGKSDRIAYMSFLHSPFINLSTREIERIINNADENKELTENLDEEGKEKVRESEELISELTHIISSSSITSAIDYLWFDRGYRYFIEEKKSNTIFSEHYDYLYSFALDFDNKGKGIIDFLDTIRPLIKDKERVKDVSILKEETAGISIETVHKSKGLEYPIVILFNMGAGNRNNSNLYSYKDGNIFFPYMPITDDKNKKKLVTPYYLCNKDEEIKKENAEMKRILYVAATRSEYHMIFSGVFTSSLLEKDEDGNEKPKGVTHNSVNTILQYLVEGLNFDFENKTTIIDSKEFFPVNISKIRESKYSPKPESYEWYEKDVRMKKEEPKKMGVTTLISDNSFHSFLLPTISTKSEKGILLPSIEIDNILSSPITDSDSDEESSNKITEFGTLTHKTIEDTIIGEEGDYSSFFPSPDIHEIALNSAFTLRDNFFSSSFYKDHSSWKKEAERRFIVMDGETQVDGIVDLTLEKDNEIIIVDYKTDSYRRENSHKAQLMYYVNALKTIYTGKEIHAYVFYLRDPDNPLKVI